MENIDFEPNNYSSEDIIKVFDLDNFHNITINDIENNYIILKKEHSILDNSKLDNLLHNLKNRLKIIINKNDENIIKPNNDIISYNAPDRNTILNNSNTDKINDSYIIQKKSIEPRDTFTNKYPDDTLNPIRKKTIKKIVSIDTLFNSSLYKSNDFTYFFGNTIKNVVSLKVTSLELPNIWYSFNENNHGNIFYIDFFNMSDNSGNFIDKSYTITIPPGNYTPLDFQESMNNLFSNIEPNQGPDFLKLRINPLNGNVVIRANNINDNDLGTSPVPFDTSSPYYSPDFYFVLRFALENKPERPLYYNAGWMMGFRKETYTVTENETFTNLISTTPPITYVCYLESESYYGSNTLTYIYLDITDFNKNHSRNVLFSTDNGFSSNDIIAKIPLTSGTNTIVINTSGDQIFKQRDYFGPVNLEKIRIRLLDKFGNLIDMNDNDYSLTLEITQIYS